MVFLGFRYGLPMLSLWGSYGFALGFPMVLLWFSYGFGLHWLSYGFALVFGFVIGTPKQNHRKTKEKP